MSKNILGHQRLLLYTDGLNEAENRQQEQYGEDRIIKLLTSLSASSCRDIVEDLKADTDKSAMVLSRTTTSHCWPYK